MSEDLIKYLDSVFPEDTTPKPAREKLEDPFAEGAVSPKEKERVEMLRVLDTAFSNTPPRKNSPVGKVKPTLYEVYEKRLTDLRISTVPSTELKNLHIPPRQKILGDWFRESDLGFVFARRGLGKTWFSTGLATAIANKTSFGPWKVHYNVPILYVDGEMPCESMEERISSMGASDRLFVLNHEGLFHHSNQSLNLADPETQKAVTNLCIEKEIKVLILDNLSCLYSGLRENDNDDWEMVLPWLLHLRRNRIAVIIVAHSGRDGKNMRGASRREDHAFFVIRLEDSPSAGIQLQEGARFISSFTKNRNSRVEEVNLEWTFQSDGLGNVHILHKEADRLSVFLDLIKGGLTGATDLAEEMGVTKGYVSKMASQAILEGKLIKVGRGYGFP